MVCQTHTKIQIPNMIKIMSKIKIRIKTAAGLGFTSLALFLAANLLPDPAHDPNLAR